MTSDITVAGIRLDMARDPLLALAAQALAWAEATPVARSRAATCARFTWRPVFDHLPDRVFDVDVRDEDWQWGREHASRIGVTRFPWPTMGAYAREMTARVGPRARRGQEAALSLATVAHVARTHPHAYALALVTRAPARFRPREHPCFDTDPRLGGLNAWIIPAACGGVGGLMLSHALADLTGEGLWGSPAWRGAHGVIPIPPAVWATLERMGWRERCEPSRVGAEPDF